MMTIQNGLGAKELLRAHGDWPLISAVTFMSGVRHADTHVEYELDTETWLGPYAGRRPSSTPRRSSSCSSTRACTPARFPTCARRSGRS